jgi:ABC-2 type transport system permease protein
MVKQGGHKRNSLIKLTVGVLVAVAMVVLSGFAFQRFDLTEEKRHTLSPATVTLMSELKDVVFIKVYLKGDYPAEYKRLERAIQERLDEMKAYAGDNLQYEFINPSESESQVSRNETYEYLQEAGLQYTNITFKEKDQVTEKIIFPGALVTYQDKTMPLQLLKSNERVADPNMIINSVNNLEYEFAQIIRRITSSRIPSIAFIEGHGELSRMETSDAENILSENYNVERVTIDGQLNALSDPIDETGSNRVNKYDLLIIASPQREIGDADKFHIDQFIMRGGKVMWFLDPIDANLDSLRNTQQTMGRAREFNVEDLLFNYGVRLNKSLMIDRSCAPIAITTGMKGNQPQMELFPWYFKPIFIPRGSHPIVSNIEPVVGEFVSSLDLIDRPDIKKTVLLSTSENTRMMRAPVRINLNIVNINPDFKEKRISHQNVAVLLEGTFESPLFNLISPKFTEAGFKPRKTSLPTSVFVAADGDLIKNRVSADGLNYFPLGFDRYAKDIVYGNREFLLNTVNHMLDDEALISVRSRSIKLRKMNDEKVIHEGGMLKAANVGLPVLLMIILGLILNLVRKSRYTKG